MEIRILSEMARVMEREIPARYVEQREFYALSGECLAFQLAHRGEARLAGFTVQIESDLPFAMYCVRPIGVQASDRFTAADDPDYLGHESGQYPDYLERTFDGQVINTHARWQALYFLCEKATAGEHRAKVTLTSFETGDTITEAEVVFHVSEAALSLNAPHYTRWFHCDSLADYYGVPIFSEKHWEIIEAFMKKAAQRGMDTVLTPIHTPPLDTDIGRYRPAVQLVDILVTGENEYAFSFPKFDRWVALCEKCGIRYFEMAHLFSQWGAKAAPQIMARKDGALTRIFGWDTPADSPKYQAFLNQYIAALVGHLSALGIADRCRFHISDEPNEKCIDSYRAAKQRVEALLPGAIIMDALSDVRFYNEGVADHPVPAVECILPFVEAGVRDLWTYYCCCEIRDVPNSFIIMPGERLRALGLIMYRYDIKGFLQWGYNFYYTSNSRSAVNPFRTADGDGIWPAGDPFIVYPGRDGTPEDSLRSVEMQKALEDYRALKRAEEALGRERVMEMMTKGRGEAFTFMDYPREEGYYLALRETLYRALQGENAP